jgi:hypothetical protein
VVSVVVALVVGAAAVLVAELMLALPVLLNLEAVLVGFTRRVQAELLELERAEAELGSVWDDTLHTSQHRRRRFAPQPPGDQ